jgi:hypothetical protein
MHKLKTNKAFSKSHFSVFLIVFAVLGLVILIKSFAAPNPSLPGDLNNDNTVNVTDLSIMLSDYNSSDPTKIAQADINSDGAVNVIDLSTLLSHYGESISAKPSVPTGLTATAGDGSVALKWNPNPATEGVDTYQVYWTTDSAWGTNNNNLNVTGTSYTVTGLTNGTTYYFRISAHNASGYGDWGTAISAVPQAPAGTGTNLGTKLPARMPESSGSKTLYVSPSGSGTSCSQTSPCSFNQAWSLASSGTIINLLGGSYSNYFIIQSKRYSSTNPVTLQSSPGQMATFTGCASACPQNVLYFGDDLGIRVRNITVVAPNNSGAGIKFEDSSYLEADHNTVKSVGGNGMLINGATISGFTQTYCDHIQLWNNTMISNGNGNSSQSHGFYFGGGSSLDGTKHGVDGFTIANNLIYDQTTGYGIQVGDQTANGFVVNNTIDHSYSTANSEVGTAIVVWGAGGCCATNNVIVANNLLTNNIHHALIGVSNAPLVGINIYDNMAFGNGLTDYLNTYGTVTVFSLGPQYADANPLYVSQPNKDFRLQAGSPALNKGDPAYVPPYNHDGTARSVAAIGAY